MKIINFDTKLKRLDVVEVLDERDISYQLVEHSDAAFPDVYTRGTYKIALSDDNYERLVQVTEIEYPFQQIDVSDTSSGLGWLVLVSLMVIIPLVLLIYYYVMV